ncbi:hypothetical protein SAMN06265218_1285 [Fodinibius sediminis]|uniref:Uncharacterized protein n=1 Tax=Fodinibius sediminis TaxID=1214077 RepID=A0A521FCF2_9BACT|nr:hypothetical protein SAMN06265218_1285 [Fodinibius sediminis]
MRCYYRNIIRYMYISKFKIHYYLVQEMLK